MFKKPPSHYRSKVHPLTVVVPLVLWGIYRRIQFRAAHNLWRDELYQAQLCDRPFFDFIKTLPKYDFCRYLNVDYFLTYPFFKLFGFNKWGLAVPHILAMALGFYFLYLICRKKFTTVWGYLVAFALFSSNLTIIRHSLEIRPYGVLPMLSLAAFYFTDLLMLSEQRPGFFKKLGIGACFTMIIWFHPYGVLILFFIAVFFLVPAATDWPALKHMLSRVAPFYLTVLLVAMPLWFYSMFGFSLDIGTARDVFQFIPNPLVDQEGFLKGVFCNLVGYKYLYVLVLGLVLPFVLPYQDRYKQIAFFLILVIIPIQIVLLMDMKSYYWFIQRQFIWNMSLFAYLLGWCWDSGIDHVFRKFKQKG